MAAADGTRRDTKRPSRMMNTFFHDNFQIRRLILERRASREADLPEEVDGNRFTRKKSTDYKEFSDAQTLADLQQKYDQAVSSQYRRPSYPE